MAWVKIDDRFDENPKLARVGPLGLAMWVVGITYCNRNLTDGFIPWAVAQKLLAMSYLSPPDDEGREKVYTVSLTTGMHGEDATCADVIRLLVDAGLWDEVPGGYAVHDYLQHQESKATILAERNRNSKRQKEFRGRSVSHTVSNSVTNALIPPVRSKKEEVRLTDSSLRSESAEPSLRSGSGLGGTARLGPESETEAVQSEPRARGHANGAHSLAHEPADGFADWYAAYPRHVAKLAAQRAYRTALKRTSAEILLAGAKRYAAATAATDPDKIKHPATWLNGGCWEDERAGPRASRGRAIMEFGLQLKAQEEAS